MGACAPNPVHGLRLGVSSLWTQVGSKHYTGAKTLAEVQEPILEQAETEAVILRLRSPSVLLFLANPSTAWSCCLHVTMPRPVRRYPAFATFCQLLVGEKEIGLLPAMGAHVAVRPINVRAAYRSLLLIESESAAQADLRGPNRPDLPGVVGVAYRRAKRDCRCLCILQSRSPLQRGLM